MNTNPLNLFWEGYRVNSYTCLDTHSLLIRLLPCSDHRPNCGRCGKNCCQIHDCTQRRLRERDLFSYQVWLEVPVRRVLCPNCGPSVETISWLDPRQRLTRAMVTWVETLVRLMPVAHVAKILGLNWHTVKAIDKRRLHREVKEPDRQSIRRLIMDEFALFKGHRYATVVINADNQQVLWVGEGRSRKAIQPFFEWLGEPTCQQIEAVAMDMNTAMDLEVQQHCPKARVVYDLFHVIAKFGREVIDRVRGDQANQLRQDKPARRVVKQSRWLLLRNRQNLQPSQTVQLEELLAANQSLFTVYVLKDQLRELWYAPSPFEARRRWREWYRLAMDSGLEPLRRFAKNLKPYLRGIISSSVYPLNTSILEGMNNKIKVIKRMAYGFRDQEYFFLKIKAAFPGKVR